MRRLPAVDPSRRKRTTHGRDRLRLSGTSMGRDTRTPRLFGPCLARGRVDDGASARRDAPASRTCKSSGGSPLIRD